MVNKAILIGNVGSDPEIRYLEGGNPGEEGVAVANLTLATSESYKNKNGEKITQTEWHKVIFWRGLAKVVENYVKKGMQLYIEGHIKTRSWDDKNSTKRYTTEIWADNMTILSKKNDKPSEGTEHITPPQNKDIKNIDSEDDLPF